HQSARVPDAGLAVQHILVAGAVISSAFDLAETGKGRKTMAERMFVEPRHQHLGQFPNAGFVARVANVEDLAVASVIAVFDDAKEALDAVGDIGEAALLVAAVNELDRRAFDQVENELGDHARAADSRG